MSGRSRGEQAKAVAAADILEAAEESTVAAHGLVVGLDPSTPHWLPHAVTLKARNSAVLHLSADVAATRSVACPDLLMVETVGLASRCLRLALGSLSAVENIQTPGKGPKAVWVGKGVDRAGDQIRVAGCEIFMGQINAVVGDGACGSLVVALP